MRQNRGMKVICITGGMGSGKSRVLQYLKEKNIDAVNADEMSREVVCKGEPALVDIVEEFGAEYLDVSGNLDRKKLGNLVFADRRKLDILENILYSYIKENILKYISDAKLRNREMFIVEAINPFDKRFFDMFDEIWVVHSNLEKRIERVEKRDGLKYNEAMDRIKSQKSDEEYFAIADRVIENNDDSFDEIKVQIDKILGE